MTWDIHLSTMGMDFLYLDATRGSPGAWGRQGSVRAVLWGCLGSVL